MLNPTTSLVSLIIKKKKKLQLFTYKILQISLEEKIFLQTVVWKSDFNVSCQLTCPLIWVMDEWFISKVYVKAIPLSRNDYIMINFDFLIVIDNKNLEKIDVDWYLKTENQFFKILYLSASIIKLRRIML